MNDLFSPAKSEPSRTVRVEFDGGAKGSGCTPGSGWGYGSFKIDAGPVNRVDFEQVMTAQAAEVLTLIAALESVPEPATARVVIHGDSQVALSCAQRIEDGRKKVKLKGSPLFQQSQLRLAELVRSFAAVGTEWRGRAASVALFGH